VTGSMHLVANFLLACTVCLLNFLMMLYGLSQKKNDVVLKERNEGMRM
jgi:hypothetical protein